MLDLLQSAISAAPRGLKGDVTFNDDQRISDVTIIAADKVGIAISGKTGKSINTMIPWTAIGTLDIHHY